VSRILDNPLHWRKRARETRALADQVDNPYTKRALLDIAGRYDRLAERAEERNRTPDGQKS
jgi:hypothetical protein